VPEVRPFRALRYEPEVVGDLAAVVSPPSDEIDSTRLAELAARHPKNAVRLDRPIDQQGDEPDDRYRRTARTLAGWRSDGTLRKDPRPSLYAYEQRERATGSPGEVVRRGFFGRLRLEPLSLDGSDPAASVIAAAPAMPGDPGALGEPGDPAGVDPREERYRLLRATGVNTSPIVGLFVDPTGAAGRVLATTARTNPLIDLVDDRGVRHRMWALAADGPAAEGVATLIEVVGAGPVTIADRIEPYEAALRYRDERRMSRSCEEDPAFDYILTLFVEAPADGADRTRPLTGLVINPHEW
jgi:uncharacterized protein (DUF1015 family)